MQDQLKKQGLDIASIIVLFALLIIPQIVGLNLITALGVTEVMQYQDIFIALVGVTVTYFLVMMFFHQKLINRIYDLVYLKYLVVIIILFWLMYDGVTAYFMQENYFFQQGKIAPRDIVWSDVPFADMPDYIIYPDFRYAFMFCLCVTRLILVLVLAMGLMSERKTTGRQKKVIKRHQLRNKSVSDLKAGLHPSILKKYQDNKNTE